MKIGVLLLLSFLISATSTRLTKTSNKISAFDRKPDPRKLFLSFTWNANEQRYVQRERMKEIMKNNLKNLMERYQFETHLDQWNHELMEDVHRQFYKAKSNVQLAKHFLIEKMDNLYNNFVQPSRWFY
jgi:hypothetical protein